MYMKKTVIAVVTSVMLSMAYPASAQEHIKPPPCVMELSACEVILEAQSRVTEVLSENPPRPDNQRNPQGNEGQQNNQNKPNGNQGNPKGNSPQDPQEDAPKQPPENPPDDAPRGPPNEPEPEGPAPPQSGQSVNAPNEPPSVGEQELPPNVVTPVEPDTLMDAPTSTPTEEPTEQPPPPPILPGDDRVFTQGELTPFPPDVQNAISDNIAIVLALLVFGIWLAFIYPVKRRMDSIASEIQSVRQILENPKV